MPVRLPVKHQDLIVSLLVTRVDSLHLHLCLVNILIPLNLFFEWNLFLILYVLTCCPYKCSNFNFPLQFVGMTRFELATPGPPVKSDVLLILLK